MHSRTATSSARSSIASATRCKSMRRTAGAISRHDRKASAAAVAARSMSSAIARAAVASSAPSIGDLVSKDAPEIEATILPSIMCPMPSLFRLASRGPARSRLALKMSDLGVALSMGSLRFQGVVNVVAFPTRCCLVDLHVERQSELAVDENGIEMPGENPEHVRAGLLPRGEVTAFAEPQQHREEGIVGAAIGDRIILAADRAYTDAPVREDAGFNRRPADDFADLGHVEAGIEIGGIFDREMRHVVTPKISEGEGHRFRTGQQ